MRDKRPIHEHETNHKLPLSWDDLLQGALLAFILAAMPAAVTAHAVGAALEGSLDASWLPGWVPSFVPPLFLVGIVLVGRRV